ncbi:MAG: DUF1572 domain-containing protein [Planctomycetota bacterium]|nr:MAG: DUF1572 domain-containing protein [Planctomycetota bacterium]
MNSVRFAEDSLLDPIASARAVFARQRAFAEHALDQLSDQQFFTVLAPGLNSAAVLVRHMAGNMLSRWSAFLTTDGEKPTRDRDAELAPLCPPEQEQARVRAQLMQQWQQGWETLFDAIEGLTEADLLRTVTIRTVKHSVALALARQLDHYAFHIGQLNIIARALVGTDRWEWFTLPPGGTKAFNAALRNRS